MCKSLKMNPKCQVCIRVSIVILAIFVVVHVILAILKAVFTKDIINAEVMSQLLGMFIENTKMEEIDNIFSLLSTVFAILTIAAVMPRLLLFLSLKCCPNSCCPKFLVFLTFLFSVIVMVIMLILGIVFTGINTVFSKEEVER